MIIDTTSSALIIKGFLTIILPLTLRAATASIHDRKFDILGTFFDDITAFSELSNEEEEFPSYLCGSIDSDPGFIVVKSGYGSNPFINCQNRCNEGRPTPPSPSPPFFLEPISANEIRLSDKPSSLPLKETKDFTLKMVGNPFSGHPKVQIPLNEYLSTMEQIRLCREVDFEIRLGTNFVESESDDDQCGSSSSSIPQQHQQHQRQRHSNEPESPPPFAFLSHDFLELEPPSARTTVTQQRPLGHPARLPSMDFCYVSKDLSYPLKNGRIIEVLLPGEDGSTSRRLVHSTSLIIALLDKDSWSGRRWDRIATLSSLQTPDPSSGVFPAAVAAAMGNLAVLGECLKKCPYFFHPSWRCPRTGATLLHYAATGGHDSVVQWMKRNTFLFDNFSYLVGGRGRVSNEYTSIRDSSSLTAKDIAMLRGDTMFAFELIKG